MCQPLGHGVFTIQSSVYLTQSVVISGSDRRCILVDPGVTPEELEHLAAWLDAHQLRVVMGFSTHPHWDHLLWHAGFGSVPRYATRAAVAEVKRYRAELIRALNVSVPGHDVRHFARMTPLPSQCLPWDGPKVHVIEHRAHAPGHAALYLPDAHLLIAGDMLSDVEIPLLDLDADDPWGDYAAALQCLSHLGPVDTVIPGHGSIGDGREFRRRLAADQRYLEASANGGPTPDARLNADWLISIHQRQTAWLAEHRR